MSLYLSIGNDPSDGDDAVCVSGWTGFNVRQDQPHSGARTSGQMSQLASCFRRHCVSSASHRPSCATSPASWHSVKVWTQFRRLVLGKDNDQGCLHWTVWVLGLLRGHWPGIQTQQGSAPGSGTYELYDLDQRLDPSRNNTIICLLKFLWGKRLKYTKHQIEWWQMGAQFTNGNLVFFHLFILLYVF